MPVTRIVKKWQYGWGIGKEGKQEVKRSLKREVDDMGDLESPGGPPVPEAGCGGTAGAVDPVIRKEEISSNEDEKFRHRPAGPSGFCPAKQ